MDDSPTNPDNVTAKGPGLMQGNVIGNPTYFEIFTTGKSMNPSLTLIRPYLSLIAKGNLCKGPVLGIGYKEPYLVIRCWGWERGCRH